MYGESCFNGFQYKTEMEFSLSIITHLSYNLRVKKTSGTKQIVASFLYLKQVIIPTYAKDRQKRRKTHQQDKQSNAHCSN